MPFEKLTPEKILSFIPTSHHPLKLEVFDSIDSTNSYLLTQAKTSDQSGWVCLAETQTNGRGRRGRTWFSPPNGNIYCSLLWKFNETTNLSGLSIAIAVILTYLLNQTGISNGLQLKWPNDLLFDGRKLAGILIESIDRKKIVIGIGINWVSPEHYNATSLTEMLPSDISRNQIAATLIHLLFRYLPIFDLLGLRAFMDDWKKYDYLIDKKIILILPNEEISGTMRGINEMGELILDTEQGRKYFCYGEASVKK